MKNFDSRVFSISDFLEWDRNKRLVLNPIFQRRSVWSPKAKSYLIDTIIRGKPIPKIFMRVMLDVATKVSIREVVDGQQRLRAIISFTKDGFTINKSHNEKYSDKLFSQLPEDVQAQILSYEIAVDHLLNLPDDEILDIFGRLNSYAVVLNEQERINSDHFGPFKTLADELGRKYQSYWTKNKILSDANILRMLEVNLVADVLIAMKEGIKPKKQIGKFYDAYETKYTENKLIVIRRFDLVMAKIAEIFPDGLAGTEFRRPHLFYSLFVTIAHGLYGIPNLTQVPRPSLTTTSDVEVARNGFEKVETIFRTNLLALETADITFLQDSRRATTDGPVRERRTAYLVSLICP